MIELLTIDRVVNEMDLFVSESGVERKIQFRFGTKTDLNAYIQSNNNSKDSIYPLIYCVTPYEATDDFLLNMVNANLTFIIAINNDDLSMDNKERLKLTVSMILSKVYRSFITALNNDTETSIVNENEIDRIIYFGFQINNDDYESSNDVNANWDAVKFKLEVDVLFNNECNN